VLWALAILVMVLRRQTEDGVMQGLPFNFIGACIVGGLAAVILVTLTGQPRWELVAGLGGIAFGGFGLGLIGLGGGE
jgi:hypothetical protein